MTLEEFAEITKKTISRDGFTDYQPTACFPDRRNVAVLAGIPDGVDMETAALAWSASKAAPGEEVLVAFKIGESRFKIVRRKGTEYEENVFDLE